MASQKPYLLATLFVLACLCHAQASSDLTFNQLAKVERFAFGGVGYAGETSDGERNFKIILSRSSAEQDFEKLYAVGNIQAKCYALVATHRLAPKRFKQLVESTRAPKAEVITQSGCLVDRAAFQDVIKRIEQGQCSRWA